MNITSYFVIVLGGFGVVWGFRHIKYRAKNKPTIGEFEYAAFSAIWGSMLLLFLLILRTTWNWPTPEMLDKFLAVPFMLTPIIA